jgi:hypothetical protein
MEDQMFKRIKRYFLRRKLKRRILLFYGMLDLIEKKLSVNHTPNWQRKQFWNDMRNPAYRQRFIHDLLKELE